MQDNETSPSGEPPQDRSPTRFFQLLAKTDKYLHFQAKWNMFDDSTPEDILHEVAMRTDDSDEYRLAHNIFRGLPKTSRMAYAFYYGGGLPVSEIARFCNTTDEKIECALEEIKSMLGSEATHEMMIRFAKTELRFGGEKFRDISIAVMQELGMDPAKVYGDAQADDPSDMPVLMDIARYSANQIAENLGIETPEAGETATADDAVNSDECFDGITDEMIDKVIDEDFDKILGKILEALKPMNDELLVKRVEELICLMNQTVYSALFTKHFKSFARIAAIRCPPLTAFLPDLAVFLPDFSHLFPE
jgi:hypothetical protein